MGTGRTDESCKDAVRIALSSGLSRRQVADDLGVGMSTLNKWVTAHRDTDVVSTEDRELARENERLRREVRILREERDIPQKSHPVLREPKALWPSNAKWPERALGAAQIRDRSRLGLAQGAVNFVAGYVVSAHLEQ
jgi:transposase